MLLSELKGQVETGKTAKLFIPKTSKNGIDVTIRVAKQGDRVVWQRARVPGLLSEEQDLPPSTKSYPSWQKFIETLDRSMQERDATWQVCDESIEEDPNMAMIN